MSQKVLTTRQTKNRINTFGIALVIYVLLFTILTNGIGMISKFFPLLLKEYDPSLISYIGLNLLLLPITLILFKVAESKLDLYLEDYYKKIEYTFGNILLYTCYAIGINLITTSLMSLFSFIFSFRITDISFLGKFNSSQLIMLNIAYFIYMIVTKPICDEFVFRGVIQRALGKFGRYFGVLGSALLYAISQGSLTAAIPAFFFGYYLSLISLKYHSIRPTILIQIIMALYFYLLNIIPQSLFFVIPISVILIYTIIAFSVFSKHKDFNLDFLNIGNKQLWSILFTSKTIIVTCFIFLLNIIMTFIKW